MADADGGDKPHFHGHRGRLRERFLNGGPEALPDYELLELVLFGAIPRGDVKPLAKRLIDRFGSFANVISAETGRLAEVEGAGGAVVATLKAVQAAALRLSWSEIEGQPVIASWDRLLDYCRASMSRNRTEQLRVLFLDRKNRLIADELQQEGTVDHTPLYPREVVRRALDLGASAIILVHNHPSGDPTPSRDDIEMTKQVAQAAGALGVRLHDHIIVGRGEHASFRSMGLI